MPACRLSTRAVPRAVARALTLALAGLLAAGALPAAACARSARSARGPAPTAERTTVRVSNQNFADMNVYVVRGGVRSRLGTVAGNSTRVLVVPATFVQPLTQLRFVADPIGGRGRSVSDEITLSPGDEVSMIIPPR